MTVRAVMLDRDGVLVTVDRGAVMSFLRPLVPLSIEEVGTRWQEWGNKNGFPRSIEEEKKFWPAFWTMLSNDLGLDETVRHQLITFNYTSVLRAFPDARPALEAAQRRGMRVGILSNFSMATLEASLVATGLHDLVDVACAAQVIGISKPHPEAYQTVLNQLSIAPSECLYFDDRPTNIEGAQAIGLQAYLVDRQQPAHDLEQRIVCDLSALPQILDILG